MERGGSPHFNSSVLSSLDPPAHAVISVDGNAVPDPRGATAMRQMMAPTNPRQTAEPRNDMRTAAVSLAHTNGSHDSCRMLSEEPHDEFLILT